MEKRKSGLATAGLVLGIIGICTSFIPIINNASFVLGLLAAIFAFVALVKRASTGKAIASLVLGLLAIIITVYMQSAVLNAINDAVDELDSDLSNMTGESTEEILKNNLDVQIGKFKVIEGEFLDETEMIVTLKNKGQERKSFSVEIEAVDKDGNRIDTDTIYANDLNAGQSQKFETFLFVTSDKYDEMKSATFKVVEVAMY